MRQQKLLLDSCEFKPKTGDKVSLIVEDVNGVKQTRARGRLSLCDHLNTNNRIYPRKVWEANLKEGSPLRERIKKNAAFGLLEHPEDGQVSLLSPISHIVTAVQLESDGAVTGEITFLNTPEGRKMTALIEAGYNPLVSSRGYGSLTTNETGADVVQDDFVCESWDVVMVPSVTTAELTPVVESTPPATSPATPPVPSIPVTLPAPTPPEFPVAVPQAPLTESSGPGKTAGPQTNHQNIMDPNIIRQQLVGLQALDPAKLTPQRFAESMRTLGELHNQVATWLAEDNKRTWQATKLHEEIDSIETSWSTAVAKPSQDLVVLTEERTKLLAVTQKVTEAGINLRKKLAESVVANGRLVKTNQEILKRGKAWKAFAEGQKGKLGGVNEKFEIAHTALDILADKYKKLRESASNDVLRLGRRVIQLEFKEKLDANPKLVESLKKATTPAHIVVIRRILEGKKPAPGAKPLEESGELKPAKPANPGSTAATIQENGTARAVEVLPETSGPRRLSESIALARRLSGNIQSENKPKLVAA